VIRVEAIHKRFGDVVAIDAISFTARDGEVTALLGPNGAGKTTTLRILTGVMLPDRGAAVVDGVDTATSPEAARRRVGLLSDQRGLYTRLTTRENVRYFGRMHGLGGAPLEARMDELFAVLDMRAIADRRVEGFSLGERLKVALARALVHDPSNVLLDEPTAGLDVMTTRALRLMVRRLRGEGRCVILSSHVMQEVEELCDRIVVVVAGRVAADATPEGLRAATGEASLEEAFVRLVGGDAPEDGARRGEARPFAGAPRAGGAEGGEP